MPDHSGKVLLDLPMELLHRVRRNIHSLEDHVSFSLTCKTTYNLYNNKFWEFACKTSGWTLHNRPRRKRRSVVKSGSIWAGLSRIVVADAPTFAGYYNVDFQVDKDTIFEDIAEEASTENPVSSGSKDPEENAESLAIMPTTLARFGDLHFTWESKLEEIWTLPNYPDNYEYTEDPWEVGAVAPKLYQHPFIGNRFVTTQHHKEVIVDNGINPGVKFVTNPNGVTVHDACTSLAAMAKDLPEKLVLDNDSDWFERFDDHGGRLTAIWGR